MNNKAWQLTDNLSIKYFNSSFETLFLRLRTLFILLYERGGISVVDIEKMKFLLQKISYSTATSGQENVPLAILFVLA